MKQRALYKIFFCALLFFYPTMYSHSWIHHDFDTAMRKENFLDVLTSTTTNPDQTLKKIGIAAHELFNFFKNLYNKNNPTKIQPCTEPKIPKIIHQIWLGSPVPDCFKAFMASWKVHHPGWQYILWTDDKVKQLALHNQKLFDAATNFGEKADILRYELLHTFGGVYADCDQECLNPLDLLNYTYDFYIGIQPLDINSVQLGIGLMASVPRHPILQHCIASLPAQTHLKNITGRTGPIHFTKSFFFHANKGTIDIALPAFYFYPLGSRETMVKKDEWQQQGAFAMHHWARSWMPQKYRRKQFKNL